jgi:enamine deaminase RidA (YjgF/YER057c/UK114 family)
VATADHPYSLAYERDGIVYVSGAVGVDENHEPVLGDRECLDAAMDAVRRRLESLGLGLAAIAKASYFVTDVSLRDHANAQFVELFDNPRPARTFVEVAALPYGARVAIEAVAHR